MKQNFKKRKYLLQTLLLFLLLSGSQSLFSQIYPVQATPILAPPYLGNLSEYSTTLNEKFFVNLFTNDLTITNRQVQLKLYLQGGGFNAVSAPVINGYVPIYVTGGEALQITNTDLAPYLQLQNLQGINPAQYANALPQGLYKFCVEVIDYATQQPISLKSCANAYFIVNDPPFLNLPTNHENISFLDVQNIFFSWTPRHINATNIEYEFTLVELQDNQAPSNYSFFIAQPLYQTTQNNTVLLYGPAQPLLIAGKKYAWRVRAKTQAGFGETATFQNNGYSEIFDFVYQGNCDKPQFTLAEVTATTKAKITWQPNPSHISYLVQYRKKNTTTWFEVESTTTEVNLFDLEPLTTYEFRVGGYCAGNVLSFSNTNEFTQPNTNITAVNCGIMPTVDLSNQTLFTGNLGNGQVFMAGDFPIHVTEGSGSGSYTGKGWTKAPYLNSIKLAVIFSDIKINTSMQLVQGEVKAVYDPTWSNVTDINEAIDLVENVLDVFQQDTDEHNYSVNFPIGNASNITVVNGHIVVVNPATGTTGATYDFDQGETTIITDSTGSVYAVSPDGVVLPQQGVGVGIPDATTTENIGATGAVTGLSSTGIKVIFKRSSKPNLASKDADDDGVGANANAKIRELYKTIKDGQNNEYKLYYKGIVNPGKGIKSYDYVAAEITVTDATLNLANLSFNKKGIAVKAVDSVTTGNTTIKILKVPVFNTVGEEELLALLKNGTAKKKVVGAMVVVPIKDVGEINVTFVPVKGATIPVNIEEQLNSIYGGSGARLKITVAPNYDTTITTLECGTSGVFANYTSNQRTFIDGYKTLFPAKANEYYVFVTTGIAPSRPISGFMPLHRQFGFVFNQPATTGDEIKSNTVGGLAALIAHEIGHGVFELEHPWEKFSYNKTSGSTPWLMDYASGTTLSYRYWQTISHPKDKLYLFQSDSSGAYPTNNLVTNLTIDDLSTFSELDIPFLTPTGQIITLKKEDFYDLSFGLNGSLIGFSKKSSLSSTRYFSQILNSNPNKFLGYSEGGSNSAVYLNFNNLGQLPTYVYLVKQGSTNCKMLIEKVSLNEYVKYDYLKQDKINITSIVNSTISSREVNSIANCKNEILDTLISDSYTNNPLTVNDCDLVINHLYRYFSPIELENFVYSRKIDVIKFFKHNKCVLQDNYLEPRKAERYFSSCFEKIAIDKQDAFLNTLITDNVLDYILSEVDTKWLLLGGVDNLTKVLSNLALYANNTKNKNGFKDDVVTINFNNSNNILVQNDFLFNLNLDKFTYDSGNNLIYLLLANNNPISFGAFDPIIVNFIAPVTFNGVIFKGLKPMPAIFFYLIANEKANQNNIAAANVVLDVVSIISGFALAEQMLSLTGKAVLKSPKFWRHVVGVTLAAGNITVNTVLIDKLAGTDFLEYWNTINLLYGITDLGFNINEFISARATAKTKLISENTAINQSFDEIANDLETKVASTVNTAGNLWDDIILRGNIGVVEALSSQYKNIDEFLAGAEYATKVSSDFVKYQARGGTLDLLKYTNKHKVITGNRMRGKIAETVFQDLEKGIKPDFSIPTSDGPRFVDNLLNNTARELKSGKISLTDAFKRQVRKDLEIIKAQGDLVDRVEWHALDGIDNDALKFIRDEMNLKGVNATDFKVVVY